MAFPGNVLGKLLVEEKLCPPNARVLELIVRPTEPIIIRYEVFVEMADVDKLLQALTRFVAERSKTDGPD
jgi:hypothetical protein